jgi:nucleoside-diphosphate-sugar epimerase
MAAIKGC